jgi:hypothetical protein
MLFQTILLVAGLAAIAAAVPNGPIAGIAEAKTMKRQCDLAALSCALRCRQVCYDEEKTVPCNQVCCLGKPNPYNHLYPINVRSYPIFSEKSKGRGVNLANGGTSRIATSVALDIAYARTYFEL